MRSATSSREAVPEVEGQVEEKKWGLRSFHSQLVLKKLRSKDGRPRRGTSSFKRTHPS